MPMNLSVSLGRQQCYLCRVWTENWVEYPDNTTRCAGRLACLIRRLVKRLQEKS